MSLSELNETEIIAEAGIIANALADLTSSTEESIFAANISLAVDILSILNKYENIYVIRL